MRRRDREEQIREELTDLRKELERGDITPEQHAHLSARLLHELAKLKPRRRYALT